MRNFALLSLLSLVVSACGDDAGGGSGGGATSGAGGESSSTTSGGGAGTTSSAGGGGAGGTGGGHACAAIEVGDLVSTECAQSGPLALGVASSVLCTSDPSVAWPVTVYAVEVSDGDCLYLRADDVGATGESDLFGAVVDPDGQSLLLDDESACAGGGLACFEGGVTIVGTGTAYVLIGAWESEGCVAGGSTPFELSVSVNGTDVALSSDPFCEGDLQQIIP